jgi:hypothetical protein
MAVRMTAAQAVAFQDHAPALLESQLTGQVLGFMSTHGWHPYRMNRIVVPALKLFAGEPGVTDWLFRYYNNPELQDGSGLLLWVEFKRDGDRRKCQCLQFQRQKSRRRCTVCDQKTWQERERKWGGRVWKIDTLEQFLALYEKFYGWLHKAETGRGQLRL